MKNHYLLTHILSPVFLGVCFLGCTGGSQYRALLEQADSLMATYPDSAYALLNSIDSVSLHSQRKNVRMRYELLLAEAQNKLCIPFRTDSVLREVVCYYDRHGSSNQQLKARYLLGCTYRDLHEAPIALLTWEDAITAADTTSADCDYATLFRVYGQMAQIYMRQHLPEEQLKAQMQMSHFALLAEDTLNNLRGQLLCNSAYYTLGDTAAIFANSETVRKQYLDLGLTKEAAKVYPTPIHVAVENSQYERARKMMDEYEQHSGLFDSEGNIKDPTRAQYHYYKGVYYLGIHLIDSAEMQFRHLLSDSIHIIDAYRGLFALYNKVHKEDSAIKYGPLYEDAMGRFLDNQNGDAIIQAQAMYDYSRQEKIATSTKRKSQIIIFSALIIGLLFVLAALITYLIYLKKKNAIQKERQILLINYNLTKQELEDSRKTVLILRRTNKRQQNTSELLTKEKQKVNRLENEVTYLEKLLDSSIYNDLSSDNAKLGVIQLFHYIATPKTIKDGILFHVTNARRASEKEWEMLIEVIRLHYPTFFAYITVKYHLSKQKYRICILSRLSFNVSEMSTLLQTSPTTISNARIAISKTLFNIGSSNGLNERLAKL
ncbi:MAG: hypothetical protein IJV27_00435 [Prevotella sp.]|nr:hypothetical protein [Prevotella sp.]